MDFVVIEVCVQTSSCAVDCNPDVTTELGLHPFSCDSDFKNILFDALAIVDVSCKPALTDIYGVVAASKIENIMMGQ